MALALTEDTGFRAVLIDTGPLGFLANPRSARGIACNLWATALVQFGVRVIIPEICDYEIRRELLRAGLQRSITQLDKLADTFEYLPLTTSSMRRAAQLWAIARQQGRPTADPKELDGDVILAAQALDLGLPSEQVVVATLNAGHISRFVRADDWHDIHP